MKIDDSIVLGYLQGSDDYEKHWLFYQISENGEYTFERPDPMQREMVEKALRETKQELTNFKPYNRELFSELFPGWKDVIRDANVILSVGCPKPYDALLRRYDGKDYMIFDLIRFMEYQKAGKDMASMIRGLLTHEVTHSCIHADYPEHAMTYQDKLEYIVFDEGFAHILSFTEDVKQYNFKPVIQRYYEGARKQLKEAFLETDSQKKEEYLELSNCGAYWDKFAAISGKLYLADHLDEILTIYQMGPHVMMSNILK